MGGEFHSLLFCKMATSLLSFGEGRGGGGYWVGFLRLGHFHLDGGVEKGGEGSI